MTDKDTPVVGSQVVNHAKDAAEKTEQLVQDGKGTWTNLRQTWAWGKKAASEAQGVYHQIDNDDS